MSPLSRDKGHTCSLRYHSRCRIATTLRLPISKTVRDNGDFRLLLLAYLKIKLSPVPHSSFRFALVSFIFSVFGQMLREEFRPLKPPTYTNRRLSLRFLQITDSLHCISINMWKLYHRYKPLSIIFAHFFASF